MQDDGAIIEMSESTSTKKRVNASPKAHPAGSAGTGKKRDAATPKPRAAEKETGKKRDAATPKPRATENGTGKKRGAATPKPRATENGTGKKRGAATPKPRATENGTGKKRGAAIPKPRAAEKETGKKRAAAAPKPRAAENGAGKKRGAAVVRAKAPAKPAVRTGRASSRTAVVEENPVASARHRDSARPAAGDGRDERLSRKPGRKRRDRKPPRRGTAAFAALNVLLLAGIAALVMLIARQERCYADFRQMRQVVDRQTFYAGTTVEGVDVSRMTLSNALDYWRDRVEPRYAGRTVTLDSGETVTSGQLGYRSDYESVLTAAWSAGRYGSLEERYLLAAQRAQAPVAYSVRRTDYDRDALDSYVQSVADALYVSASDAKVEGFNAETYEFTFTPSREGRRLDADALKQDIARAIADGGGSVRLSIETLQPRFSTEEVASHYGLIDYAITNASASTDARLKNIRLAMSIINGTRVAPGETFSFNETVGERTYERGFRKAPAYSAGDVTDQVGGGICQVSTTLFNAVVKADLEIVERHNHSMTVSYVDKGKDATVDWGNQDFRFKNTSSDDIYICCYLTDDKRVRFGIFGMLLPNGEKITFEAETTLVVKHDTVYEATPLLLAGETHVQQKGRDGYRAEAYKVRWDAEGNQLSRELLCKSVYRMRSEVVLYGV
uniref:Putative VanW family protein n=1 Tax=uncultured bacterium Ad_125_D08 TaxID=1489285 RepID=A0A0B4N0X7_9BACT|nr:putative VanW family protein [uncultured bacterium Ad_125_D08]